MYIKSLTPGGPDIRLIDSPLADENAVWPPVREVVVQLGRMAVHVPGPYIFREEDEYQSYLRVQNEIEERNRSEKTPTVRDVMQTVADWFFTDWDPGRPPYMSEEAHESAYRDAELYPMLVKEWIWNWWYRWRGVVKTDVSHRDKLEIYVRLGRVNMKD